MIRGRPSIRLLIACTLLLGDVHSICGQVDLSTLEIDRPADEPDEEMPEEAPQRARVVVRKQRGLSSHQEWLQGWQSLRRSQQARLRIQIEQTCAVYRLSDSQRRKLLIAGLADILRFQDDVQKLRSAFNRPEFAGPQLEAAKTEFERLFHVVQDQPYRSNDSLYVKVLNRILKTENILSQPIVYLDDPAALEALQEIAYYRALVTLIGDALVAQAPLRDGKQRIQLAEMLRQTLQSNPRIPLDDPRKIWQCLRKMPPKDWSALLDETQYQMLQKKFNQIDAEDAADRTSLELRSVPRTALDGG